MPCSRGTTWCNNLKKWLKIGVFVLPWIFTIFHKFQKINVIRRWPHVTQYLFDSGEFYCMLMPCSRATTWCNNLKKWLKIGVFWIFTIFAPWWWCERFPESRKCKYLLSQLPSQVCPLSAVHFNQHSAVHACGLHRPKSLSRAYQGQKPSSQWFCERRPQSRKNAKKYYLRCLHGLAWARLACICPLSTLSGPNMWSKTPRKSW